LEIGLIADELAGIQIKVLDLDFVCVAAADDRVVIPQNLP
jgi:hypothetical protein